MADGSAALRQEPRSRYRYAVLLIGFVTLAGASGVSGCFAVFYNTLVTAFTWSRASGASPYSVNMLVSIISAPLSGWLLDRYGPRVVLSSAALLSGGALITCSTLQSLGHFVVYYGVLGAVGQTALASVAVIVSRWFAHTQRGRAIGFADVGTGFGMVLFIPGSAWLIETFGWRPAFAILGAVIVLLLVPLNLWQRRPPVESGHTVSSASFGQALRHRAFWMLCLAHCCMTVTMTMVNVHLVPFLVSSGRLELLTAASISSARVIFRHVLPNTFSSIIVLSTLQVAQAILQEAALSFLGVGSGRTYPTWGQMIALGRDFVSVAWWLPTFPGLAILATVLAINLVGDRLRDALDPRV